MGIEVKGLQELIDLVEELSDEKTLQKICKDEVIKVGEQVLSDMIREFPTAKSHVLHGINYLELDKITTKDGGIKLPVGIRDMNTKGSWSTTRGLWFTQYVGNQHGAKSPNEGYYEDFYKSHKDEYDKELNESISKALDDFIKRNGGK